MSTICVKFDKKMALLCLMFEIYFGEILVWRKPVKKTIFDFHRKIDLNFSKYSILCF